MVTKSVQPSSPTVTSREGYPSITALVEAATLRELRRLAGQRRRADQAQSLSQQAPGRGLGREGCGLPEEQGGQECGCQAERCIDSNRREHRAQDPVRGGAAGAVAEC